MSEWVNATVEDVTKYQKAGGTPLATNPNFYNGDIPFVVIEDITNSFHYLTKTSKTLNKIGLDSSAAWFIDEPHVLYSMYATVGKPIISKISCATNQAIIALKENELIEQEFLYYQLLFIRPSVYKFTAQTTQLNLNAGVVKRLPISYPKDKSLQIKIIKILQTIDQTIEKTEALIEKYQQIKAGLMNDLFTRGIGADGKLRPPREQAPALYQQTPIGWIPKDWKVKSCQDVFNIDSGITLGLHRRPKYQPRPYLRVANVFKGKIVLKEISYLEASDEENLKYSLNTNDILLIEGHANIQEIGRCALVKNNAEGMLFQNHLFRLKAIKISPIYGMYFLNSFIARKHWLTNCSTSSGLNTINRKMLGKMIFFVPSFNEQIEIEDRFNYSNKLIENESNFLYKVRYIKSGLMHDLLTGIVQVPINTTEAEHV